MPSQILEQPSEPELRNFPQGNIVFRGLTARNLLPFVPMLIALSYIATRSHWIGLSALAALSVIELIVYGLEAAREKSLLRGGCVTVGEVERQGTLLVVVYKDQKGDKRTHLLRGRAVRNVYMAGDKVTVLFDPDDLASMRRWALYPEMMLRLRPVPQENASTP